MLLLIEVATPGRAYRMRNADDGIVPFPAMCPNAPISALSPSSARSEPTTTLPEKAPLRAPTMRIGRSGSFGSP